MKDILKVQADAQIFEVRIPIDRISHIVITAGCHCEWVRLDPKEYEKRFCFSHIKSVPCCERGLESSSINDILNRLHDSTFGAGGWLNMKRCRLLALPPGQESCVERERYAFSILSGTSLGSIRAELSTFSAADQTTEQPERSSDLAQEGKRKRESEPIDALKNIRKRLSEVSPTSENETDEHKKLMHDVTERICLEQLVSKVKHGISLLIKGQKTHPPPGYLPFAELSKYRQRRDGDVGEKLRQVIANLIKATEETAKQHKIGSNWAKWTQDLISENSRLKERCVNPKYASGDKAKASKELKRLEKRSRVLNQIVNKLRIYIGGHAWGIFSALGAANAVVSDLRKLPDDRLGDFVESAVDRLKDCGLETIPDNVPTINVPAVLSWLQREVDFHRTCNHLCLGEFVHEDPQITRELDQLALEQEALNSEASDYDSARSDIERRASMVITPPLSRLRALHFSSIQSDQCECSQHKAPDASGSGTSNQSIQSPTQARDRSDSGSERCSATHLGTPTTHFIPENGQRTFSEPPTAQPTPPDAAGRHGSPREGGFSNSTRTSSETIPPISQKHGVMRPQETALQDPRSPVELGDEVNPARNGGSIHEPQEDTSRTPLQRSHTTPIQQQVPLHQSSQPTGPSYSETTTLRGSQASVLVNADSLPDPRLVNAKSQAADLPQLDNQSHTQHLGSLEQPQDHTSTARPDHRADTEWSSPNLDPPFSHGVSESIEHTQADPEEYLRLVSMQSMTELRTCDELLEMSFTMDLTPSEELIDMDSVLM